MNRRSIILAATIVLCASTPLTAAADGLAIGPLEYKTTLSKGEVKKGFVDVVNTTPQPIEVHISAQAFKEINNTGGLEFYDDPAITAGVELDLTDIKILPNAGAHVYFLLDGSKLPSGDVFAAILASTAGQDRSVTVPSTQVGTLLLIENGTPPAHHASISKLQAPWFQSGNAIVAKFSVRDDDSKQLTGFSPSITVQASPYDTRQITGPLVFSGYDREVAYSSPGNYLGPVFLKIQTGSSIQSTWLFVMTGYWQWLAPLLIVILFVGIHSIRQLLRSRK